MTVERLPWEAIVTKVGRREKCLVYKLKKQATLRTEIKKETDGSCITLRVIE